MKTLKKRRKIQKKKKKLISKKEVIVIVMSIILTTAGIKASDGFFGNSTSELDGPCEKGMVFVTSETGGFCIDKFEVSASDDCPFEEPNSQGDTLQNINSSNCKAVSELGNLPWTNISQNQAGIVCAKAGKRLPTNKEWMQAALGTPDFVSEWGMDECHVDSNWDTQPGFTGQGHNCESAFGAFDMVGNVWEWVDGFVYDGMYNGKEIPGSGYIQAIGGDAIPSETGPNENNNYYKDYLWIKRSGTRGMARGGYWDNKEQAGQYALYIVSTPSFTGKGVGFRCAK